MFPIHTCIKHLCSKLNLNQKTELFFLIHDQDFTVKYLGMKPAKGLWGIKHTRKPVDDLVGLARGLGAGAPLPYLQLSVSHRGVVLTQHKVKMLNKHA